MTHLVFSEQEYGRRLQRLRAEMEHEGLDCVYLPYGANQYYMTGVNAQPTAQAASRVLAALIPLRGDVLFVVPARRRKLVEKTSWVDILRAWTFPGDPTDTVVQALRDLGLENGVIGFDVTTPYVEVESIQRRLPNVRCCSCSDIFARLRRIKSDEEIRELRCGGVIADQALQTGISVIKVNAAAADIASAIYGSVLQDGADVWQISVIAGKHKGFPEKTGQRQVQPDQFILLFPKFSYNGYYVDITRIAIIGEPNQEEKMIERAILESHAAAVETAKPGVTYDDVDRAARKVLEDYGLAQYFTHGIGHGLGLETHESPYVATNTVLQPGMVFTIEPSVYRPGQPAMRVEDTFVITTDGCERLTNLPLNIFIIQA